MVRDLGAFTLVRLILGFLSAFNAPPSSLYITVFPSYGLYSRLIFLQLDMGFIAYIDVLNKVAVLLWFLSFHYDSF